MVHNIVWWRRIYELIHIGNFKLDAVFIIESDADQKAILIKKTAVDFIVTQIQKNFILGHKIELFISGSEIR